MIAERRIASRRKVKPQPLGPFGRWLRAQKCWRFEVNVPSPPSFVAGLTIHFKPHVTSAAA